MGEDQTPDAPLSERAAENAEQVAGNLSQPAQGSDQDEAPSRPETSATQDAAEGAAEGAVRGAAEQAENKAQGTQERQEVK